MICVLLTWLVFASMINNLTMGSSPGLICTAVARQFKSWSDYHGSKSCYTMSIWSYIEVPFYHCYLMVFKKTFAPKILANVALFIFFWIPARPEKKRLQMVGREFFGSLMECSDGFLSLDCLAGILWPGKLGFVQWKWALEHRPDDLEVMGSNPTGLSVFKPLAISIGMFRFPIKWNLIGASWCKTSL